jgi:hypothetical protein
MHVCFRFEAACLAESGAADDPIDPATTWNSPYEEPSRESRPKATITIEKMSTDLRASTPLTAVRLK